MFSFSFSFSKPRIISIVLLLAILVMSLFLSSYVEGMEPETINKDAPKASVSTGISTDSSSPLANTPVAGSVKPSDGIVLGSSILSVSDITGILQNNPGVQKILEKK